MSDQSIWKMLHLLRLYARDDGSGDRTLSEGQLFNAGVDCTPDTIEPAVRGHAVERSSTGRYKLGSGADLILERCVVGKKRWQNAAEFRVDDPSVFVIMPFNEAWSDKVWRELIEPAVVQANFACVRGDMPVRVADLTNTVWNEIVSAGLILADLSAPNVNVFYELGLAHALGKDVFILKQNDVRLAADFGGAHFYEYDRSRPGDARPHLVRSLVGWATANGVAGVAALAKPAF
jgi:hypothetical protein